jgi:hypothetical protein
MPLPPHPRLHLSKVWIPMPSLHRMNDIVEAAGEGIDPLSEAGAYANESTSSSFRANSVRLMHAMYGSISKGLHPKIYGRSSWLVSERVSRLSALSSRNARTRNNRVTKPARYCSTWVRAPSAKRTSTARTGRQPEAKRRPCGYREGRTRYPVHGHWIFIMTAASRREVTSLHTASARRFSCCISRMAAHCVCQRRAGFTIGVRAI